MTLNNLDAVKKNQMNQKATKYFLSGKRYELFLITANNKVDEK